MLNRYMEWCNRWRVTLNPLKTQTILFRHPNLNHARFHPEHVRLRLWGERLELLNQVTYLGVRFTHTLNWEADVQWTIDRMRQRASLLSALCGRFGRCHPKTLIHTYKTFIRPIAEYKATLYSTLPNRLKHSFLTVDRRLLRRCQYLPFRSPSNQVYTHTNLSPLPSRFQDLQRAYVKRTLSNNNNLLAQTTLRRPWNGRRLLMNRKPKKKIPFLPITLLAAAREDLPEDLQDHLDTAPLALRQFR